MIALAVFPAVCWLWVLVATPRTPRVHSVLDALVRERLRDHQRRLVTFAFGMSMLVLLALVLARPSAVDADAEALRQGHLRMEAPDTSALRGCFATWLVAPVCWRLQPDGSWAVEGQLDEGTWVQATPLDDGRWRVAGIIVAPGPYPSAGDREGEGR